MNAVLFLIALMASSVLFAQERYILHFDEKDPKELEHFRANPSLLLSNEAIDKRISKNIPLDQYDLPVSRRNLDALRKDGFKIISTSKWLNAALVEKQTNATSIKKTYDFVKSVVPVEIRKGIGKNKFEQSAAIPAINNVSAKNYNYGFAGPQNDIINIGYLHRKGFTGESVNILVLDVGFRAADTTSYFDSTRIQNRIIGTYDFWDDTSYVYHKGNHGTYVMSLIAAEKDNTFVGTAPDANYLLAITDDLVTETHQDEFNWIVAVEWADSIGLDIVSSSLSYSIFDPGQGNYGFSDLDGNTSIIAKGADIAASKGILVVNSAGNGGRITTPCDADSILCVGGSSMFMNYDSISSFGPTFDGRIKPDVAATTLDIWAINGIYGLSYYIYGGTSGATPQISGLAACLKEAHPQRSAMEILTAIKESSHQADAPDSLIGYGIPNARKADSLLTLLDGPSGISSSATRLRTKVYPNPSRGDISIELPHVDDIEVSVIDIIGNQIIQKSTYLTREIDLELNVESGLYFVIVEDGEDKDVVKIMIE